jgi:hypothetical protein
MASDVCFFALLYRPKTLAKASKQISWHRSISNMSVI